MGWRERDFLSQARRSKQTGEFTPKFSLLQGTLLRLLSFPREKEVFSLVILSSASLDKQVEKGGFLVQRRFIL